MLRKTTLTAVVLGAALSFTIIGATEARADDTPFPNPVQELADRTCQIFGFGGAGDDLECEFGVGPIGAEPGVVVPVAIPDETAAAIETPEIEVEPSVVETPDELVLEEDTETIAEHEEVEDPASEPMDESSSDDEHTRGLDTSGRAAADAESAPIVETSTDSGHDTEVASDPEVPSDDVSEEQDQAVGESDPADELQSEMLAADHSDTTGMDPVVAALIGAMGAVALIGAATLGVVIGRRAN